MMRSRSDIFDFGYRDGWQEPTEQQKQSCKQTKASDQHAEINPRRTIIRPTRRKVIATERRDDDYKTLEPHADVDKNANDHHQPRRRANGFEPKKLRN